MRSGPQQILAAVHWVADSQDGLITAGQLAEIGVPDSTVAYRIRTGGPWRRILPGIYSLTFGKLTLDQREQAGLLFAGEGAVLTGISALRRRGAKYLSPSPETSPVHTAIPITRHRKSAGFVIVERTKNPPTTSNVAGLPCASASRAVVDMSRRLTDRRDTRALVLEVVQRGLATSAQLEMDLKKAQRRGTALLRECLAEARAGVRSAPEAEIRDLLGRAPIPEPLWNPKIYLPSGQFLAQPDGLIVESMVVLEVDSQEHHSEGDDWIHTLERAADLTAQGLLVVSLVPSRFRANPSESVRRVIAAHQHGLRRDPPTLIVVPITAN